MNNNEISSEIQIGSYLKKIRTEAKTELVDVANSTKISLKVLQALEEGDFSQLPSSTYIRGFVKNYLNFLNHDPQEALDILDNDIQRSFGSPDSKLRPTKVINKYESTSAPLSLSNSKKKKLPINMLLIAIPLILATIVAYWLYRNKDALQTKPIAPIVTTTLAPTVVAEVEEEIPPTQDFTTKLEEQELAVTTTTTTIPNKESLLYPFIKFRPLRSPRHRISIESAASEIPTQFLHKNGPNHSLYISAKRGDSWIRYKSSGSSKVVSIMLKMGQSKFLKAKELFVILGNSSVLDIFFDDRKVLLSGKAYQILTFPEDIYSNHKEPLFIDTEDGKTLFYQDYIKKMSPN